MTSDLLFTIPGVTVEDRGSGVVTSHGCVLQLSVWLMSLPQLLPQHRPVRCLIPPPQDLVH